MSLKKKIEDVQSNFFSNYKKIAVIVPFYLVITNNFTALFFFFGGKFFPRKTDFLWKICLSDLISLEDIVFCRTNMGK